MKRPSLLSRKALLQCIKEIKKYIKAENLMMARQWQHLAENVVSQNSFSERTFKRLLKRGKFKLSEYERISKEPYVLIPYGKKKKLEST